MHEKTTFAAAMSCNPAPRWLERFAARFPRLAVSYLRFDARTLGIARIYIGCLLLCDVLRRVPYLATFYSNDGLLPNHTLLWRPGADYQFSFFFVASHPHEAALLFAFCIVVFGVFTIGYRTRLFHALSLLCICSLHNRLIFFDDGSETSTRLLVFWTLFLPMGCRFSVDALRASAAPPASKRANEILSLGVLAILLQLAVIYVFNALHKSGVTWREGSAVHYVLHQDRIVTWLGFVLRSHLSLGASRVMSHATLVTESLLPVLILSPVFVGPARVLAIALGIGLHLSFALLINVGLFSANMIGFFLLLFPASGCDALARLIAARPRLHALSDRVAARATRIGRALLGLVEATDHSPSPAYAALVRHAPNLREGLVVLFVCVLGSQLLMQNAAVPRWLRPRQPFAFRLLVEYPRLYEGWGMFAPEAPQNDLHVFVDAITRDGRHVDPLNQIASRVAQTPLTKIPERLGQDDEFCDYILNIVGAPAYHGAFEEWIFNYAARTGNEQDRIVSFQVFVLEDESPPPGSTEPTHTTRRLLFEARREE